MTVKKLRFLPVLLAAAGLALAIPPKDSAPPPPPAASPHQPFAWDRDDYWEALETRYGALLKSGCGETASSARERLGRARAILDGHAADALSPESPLFSELETLLFETGPAVAACRSDVTGFLSLTADLRAFVKRQSERWDPDSPAARTTLYRLLYGARAAAEEVILQTTGLVDVPALLPGTTEPSATPAATVRGVTVHSGDILVSRGGAPTSALISRGSDYPGNFSHIAFVYVDPATATARIVEAHIEQGVVVSTVEQYLADKKLRVMLLRPRADLPALLGDPLLPHRAAERAFRGATAGHIPYDFAMDYRDHARLFCSEVASAAYAAEGIDLWAGISRISSPGLRRWLWDLGVRHFETQEPSDLEYDPQLRVVGEWRDPETLWKDHLDNAATEAMLEGAEAGARLTARWHLLPLARAAKGWSALLNLAGKVGPVPEGMPAVVALRSLDYEARHAAIVALLAAKAEAYRTRHGFLPPYWRLVQLARGAAEEADPHRGGR
jgi:hypothetical protein